MFILFCAAIGFLIGGFSGAAIGIIVGIILAFSMEAFG